MIKVGFLHLNVCNGLSPGDLTQQDIITDREDGVRADNLAHGGVVQASKWASAAVCLAHQVCIQVPKPAELHRGRQNDRRAEKEERLDHIRRYSTTANQSAAGKSWVCRELIQVATVGYLCTHPCWYFHFSAPTSGICETLQTEYSESIQKEITKP